MRMVQLEPTGLGMEDRLGVQEMVLGLDHRIDHHSDLLSSYQLDHRNQRRMVLVHQQMEHALLLDHSRILVQLLEQPKALVPVQQLIETLALVQEQDETELVLAVARLALELVQKLVLALVVVRRRCRRFLMVFAASGTCTGCSDKWHHQGTVASRHRRYSKETTSDSPK